MSTLTFLYALPILLLTAVVHRWFKRWRRSRSFLLPPGPKGLPIIGNVLDIPQGLPLWEGSMALGRQYSQSTSSLTNDFSSFCVDTDVLYLNLFGKDMIILNSTKAISDLLDKRSKIYSDKVRTSSYPFSRSHE